MGLNDLLNLFVAAILLAGIYTAMSIGMTVIYGVMKMVNLAHAGFMMLGAYFALELSQRLPIDPLVASVLAVPVFFLLGIATHRSMVRFVPVADEPTLPSLLLLFGLWLVLQNVGYSVWGADDRSIFSALTMATFRFEGHRRARHPPGRFRDRRAVPGRPPPVPAPHLVRAVRAGPDAEP